MRNIKIHMYITGIILIIMGLLSFMYPITALMSLGMLIGIGLCISGLNYLSGYYFCKPMSFIILGILDLLMGILLILRPGITAFFIPYIIGLWLFLTGFSRIGTSLWLGGARISGWWLMLINGIALIIFGCLMCASPLISALSVVTVLGVGLIIFGILAITEGYFIFL